jgi:N6-L-threonylcarbamoyladenine synthase
MTAGLTNLVLGIETSCDETACAVVALDDAGMPRVLSSVVASQSQLHSEYGGVVPELASRAHVEALLPVVREALEQAGVGLGLIRAVAVAHRPGLIGSLLVGVAGAKALAWALDKPLIGVDHVRAHLYSGLLDANVTPKDVLPGLGLVVSGGHTAMYDIASWSNISRLSSTIDDAAGEAFDKVGAMLGLPHPGGPSIDKLAREPGANDRAFDLPISRLSPTSLDFSFSGLKTAVLYTLRGVPGEAAQRAVAAGEREAHTPLSTESMRDLAASFQRSVAQALTLKLSRACDQAQLRGTTYRTLIVGGGVSANSRVRSELSSLAQKRGMQLVLPHLAYCMDNAAMIAGLGCELLSRRLIAGTAVLSAEDLALEAVPTCTEIPSKLETKLASASSAPKSGNRS